MEPAFILKYFATPKSINFSIIFKKKGKRKKNSVW